MQALSSGCELDVRRGPDWLLIRVDNLDWDPFSPPMLADDVWSIVQCHFTYRVVLELDGIELLNSYLIGQLIQLYKRIREHDGVLRICGLSEYNRRVIATCRLSDCFGCYENLRQAVMGNWQPAKPR